MTQIKAVIRQLIKEGKQVEITANLKEIRGTGEYYLPDSELEGILNQYPGYDRAGTTDFKINGKKVWLPYYLSKGFFTAQKELLLPIKVNPIFPKTN